VPFELRPPERARRVDSGTAAGMAPSTGRTEYQLNANPPIEGQPVSKLIPPAFARAGDWGFAWHYRPGPRQPGRRSSTPLPPAQSIPYFCEFVARMAAQYKHHIANSPGAT